MTLKREIKDAYIEGGTSIYVKTHSNAVYVDDNETETLTQRLNNVKSEIDNNTSQLNENVKQIKDVAINVKTFGAKGDGVTDDSQAFQNAIDYIFSINALGGKLLIPQGKYVIGTSVNPFTNKNYDFEGNEASDTSYEKKNGPIPQIIFEGSGVNNTILKSANGNEIIKGYSAEPTAIYDLTIRNLRFLGYNNQGTPVNMNSANGTIKNILFENVSFNNFDKGIVYTRDDTIAWGEQSRLILRNCSSGNNNIGYEISGDDTDLINCRSEYNLVWGLVVKGGTRVGIQNCKIQYNGNDNGINNGQVKLVGSIKSLTVDKCYFEPANVTSIATKSAFFYVCTDTNINLGSTYLYNFTIKDCFFNGKKIQKLIICQDTSNIFVKNIECCNNRIQYFKLIDNYLFDIPSSISPKGIRVTGSFEQITDSNNVDISTKFKITNNPNVVSNNGNNYNPNLTTPYIKSNGGSLQMITGSVSADALQRYFGASWFSVVKNSTGNYTITLTNSNLSTVTGNVNYIPVIITPFSQPGKILTANVEMLSATSFKVQLYDETKVAYDGGFNFMLMCSYF